MWGEWSVVMFPVHSANISLSVVIIVVTSSCFITPDPGSNHIIIWVVSTFILKSEEYAFMIYKYIHVLYLYDNKILGDKCAQVNFDFGKLTFKDDLWNLVLKLEIFKVLTVKFYLNTSDLACFLKLCLLYKDLLFQ